MYENLRKITVTKMAPKIKVQTFFSIFGGHAFI